MRRFGHLARIDRRVPAVAADRRLTCRAVQDFNQRVIAGRGARGKMGGCTWLGITTHVSSLYQRLRRDPPPAANIDTRIERIC